MFEKLREIELRYQELSQLLGDPDVLGSPDRLQKTAKAHADLQEIAEQYRQHRSITRQIEEVKGLLDEEGDLELKEMAQQELAALEEQEEASQSRLKLLLIPKDPHDSKNVILEIRAGAGGDEATLFAHEMFRMYARYAETAGWKTEILNSTDSSVGGFKEIIASIDGQGAYSRLKYESGVHRVQRVPETEAQGRVHTSAVTVAVLPEADEVDIQIAAKDLRIDRFCSSGPGGQSVNTTYSAVRITHLPTGEVVSCQDEKSQIKNKAKALKVLRSRLFDKAQQEQQDEIAENRKAMVGSGDRSEKIRTYNFPQNRVTDHRIGLTLHRLESVMGGDLDPFIDELVTHFQTEALQTPELI